MHKSLIFKIYTLEFCMPFITVELPEEMTFPFKSFAVEINRYLSEVLEVPTEKCKVKLVKPSDIFVGEGQHVYARLKVELLSGRDRKKLLFVGKELLERFTVAIRSQNPLVDCRITVDIREIDRELLFV